jgi:hypothetical protein
MPPEEPAVPAGKARPLSSAQCRARLRQKLHRIERALEDAQALLEAKGGWWNERMTPENSPLWERQFLAARDRVENLAYLRYLVLWFLEDGNSHYAAIPQWLIPSLRLVARGCRFEAPSTVLDWLPNLDARLRYPVDRLFPQFALGAFIQPLQQEWLDYLRDDVGLEPFQPEEGEPIPAAEGSESPTMDVQRYRDHLYTTDMHRHLRVAGPCSPGKAGWRSRVTGAILRKAQPPYWAYRPEGTMRDAERS